MALWSAFYPFVLQAAPSASDPALDLALLGAAREFYERTRIWRPWVGPITTVGTQRQYDLPLPNDTDLVRLEQATLNGVDFAVLDADAAGVDLSAQEGADIGLTALGSDLKKVVLTRVLSVDSVIRVQASVMPAETATGISDPDWAQYARGIAEGAKWLLLSQLNQPWTDAAAAGLARDKFDAAIAKACYRRHLGAGNTVPRRRLRMC